MRKLPAEFVFAAAVVAFVPVCTQADNQALREASYVRDVAPILRSKCKSCHFPNRLIEPWFNKGLLLHSPEAILEGSINGKVVVPGDSKNSRLIAAVSGPNPYMPKIGPPLTDKEVAVLRNWIDAGAKADESEISLSLPAVQVSPTGLFIYCSPPDGGFLRIRVYDPSDNRTLLLGWDFIEGSSWAHWYANNRNVSERFALARREDWPQVVGITLSVTSQGMYPWGTIFVATPDRLDDSALSSLNRPKMVSNPLIIPDHKKGTLTFRVMVDSDVEVAIYRKEHQVYKFQYRDVTLGEISHDWNIRDNAGNTLKEGNYTARLRFTPRRAGEFAADVAVLVPIFCSTPDCK